MNPLQADSMIENKRRAATYMSAIRKVTVLIIEQIEIQKSFKVKVCAPAGQALNWEGKQGRNDSHKVEMYKTR